MKISYDCAIDDISVYGKLIYKNSPTMKEHLKKTYYFSVPTLTVIGLMIYYFESNSDLLYAWIALGIGWVVYLPFLHKKKYLVKFKESFTDEKYQHLFGKHELTIEENFIIDTVKLMQTKTEISHIEHIEIIDNYAFVFVGSEMVLLIPEKKITDGDYTIFVNEIKSKLKR